MNFPKDTEMKTTERKLKRISLYWRIFWRQKMSREPRRNSAIRSRFIHSGIHEWEDNENYNPCSLCGVIASFKRYLTKLRLNHYKDTEFEENVNGLRVKTKDLKKNWRSAKSTSNVIFPGCCIFTERRPIQHFNQSVARCITGKKMKQNLLQSDTKVYEY